MRKYVKNQECQERMILIMSIKKLFIGCCCFAAILLFGIPTEKQSSVYAAGVQYEYEENDSYETANIINLGESVTGTISEAKDVDYYMISPSSDGKIEIDFCHTYVDSYDDWKVYVYMYEDGRYMELSSVNIDLNANERVSLPYIGAVSGKIYYVKVEKCCSGIVEKEYTITTKFTLSNYIEKELNDAYNSATIMTLNNSYSGTISKSDDKDYYKIVASENGKIMLSFDHVYVDSYDDWDVYVYMYEAGQYTELSCTNIDLNANEKIQLPYIGAVKNGIYYIKVQRCCSGVVGENYTIQTSFKTSNYIEKEVNDTYVTATDISLNHSYSGTINNLEDKDYYRIVAPEDGMMKIIFNHMFENSYDDWNVYVYKYSNGQYTELSNTNIDLNANKTVSLPQVKVDKNGVYYVKVERCCSGVVGKNYTLKAKFYTYAPSNFKAKTSKSTVKLTWASADGADGYEVYYKVGKNGTYKKLASTTKTLYSYKKLAKGKTYYFKVRAYKNVGNTTYYSTYTSSKSVKRK